VFSGLLGLATVVEHSTKIWTLADLEARFPHVVPPAKQPTGTCEAHYVGSGRYIRDTEAGPEFGHVALEASPAPAFGLRCTHRWPHSVPQADVEHLDAALLEGLFETIAGLQEPLRECIVSSTFVEHQGDLTTTKAVRIAAAMALTDLVRRAGWHSHTPPTS
jgi:hypothetical protein